MAQSAGALKMMAGGGRFLHRNDNVSVADWGDIYFGAAREHHLFCLDSSPLGIGDWGLGDGGDISTLQFVVPPSPSGGLEPGNQGGFTPELGNLQNLRESREGVAPECSKPQLTAGRSCLVGF